MGEHRIVVRGLSTGYRNFSLTGVTFELAGGDIFGLLGRSGSGKSTIINTIVGSVRPRAGTVEIISECQYAVGYSPQKNALYPFLTVRENMQTFADLYGVPRLEQEERIRRLLGRFDLTACGEKLVTQLSGGMEKRVDLAVTLVHDPAIIILDEPFNGLDVSLQRFIWELLQELAKQGKIIIITSHLLEDIQRYCTKFGLVENGHFYGNDELRNAVLRNKSASLQQFLEQLFRRDLRIDATKQT